MSNRTVPDGPFKDMDVREPRLRGGSASALGTVDSLGQVEEICEETDDLSVSSRGLLLALLFSGPFWLVVVYWLVW